MPNNPHPNAPITYLLVEVDSDADHDMIKEKIERLSYQISTLTNIKVIDTSKTTAGGVSPAIIFYPIGW